MQVIELGAGASGFQFMLSQQGLDVTSVDPLENPSGDVEWRFSSDGFDHLNAAFGGNVRFIRERIENAGIRDGTVDRVFAISVIEHVPESAIGSLVQGVSRALKPGGLLVATIDLFLDLQPFTEVEANQYGRNISVRSLVDQSGLELVGGQREELCGFEEFVPTRISGRARHGEFYVSNNVACQAIVLRKPES